MNPFYIKVININITYSIKVYLIAAVYNNAMLLDFNYFGRLNYHFWALLISIYCSRHLNFFTTNYAIKFLITIIGIFEILEIISSYHHCWENFFFKDQALNFHFECFYYLVNHLPQSFLLVILIIYLIYIYIYFLNFKF